MQQWEDVTSDEARELLGSPQITPGKDPRARRPQLRGLAAVGSND